MKNWLAYLTVIVMLLSLLTAMRPYLQYMFVALGVIAIIKQNS